MVLTDLLPLLLESPFGVTVLTGFSDFIFASDFALLSAFDSSSQHSPLNFKLT